MHAVSFHQQNSAQYSLHIQMFDFMLSASMNLKCPNNQHNRLLYVIVNDSRNHLPGDLQYNWLTIISELFTQCVGLYIFQQHTFLAYWLCTRSQRYNLSRPRSHKMYLYLLSVSLFTFIRCTPERGTSGASQLIFKTCVMTMSNELTVALQA